MTHWMDVPQSSGTTAVELGSLANPTAVLQGAPLAQAPDSYPSSLRLSGATLFDWPVGA